MVEQMASGKKHEDKDKKRRRRPADAGERAAAAVEPGVEERRRVLNAEAIEALRQIGQESCAAYELLLWDVEVSSRDGLWTVCYFVDREDGLSPGKGVTIDECALVSRYAEAVIDVDERMPTAYKLEVSSPGIERELKRPEHWSRMVGQPIRMIYREAHQGRPVWEGVLAQALTDEVALKVDGVEELVTLSLVGVKRAHVRFDFGASGSK
jgi:ribosome maturation factor RimP